MNTLIFMHEWAQEMALDIGAAQYSVHITTLSMQPPRHPGASPHHALFSALSGVAKLGRRCQVAMPAPSKAHPATAFNRYAADWLMHAEVLTHWADPARLLHAKTCIIDRHIVYIGSGNWTAAACNYNREVYIRADSADLANRLLRRFHEYGLFPGLATIDPALEA